MKIGIDARWIFRETSGIGVYTRELIRHLAQIDRKNEYVIFFRDRDLMAAVQEETGIAQSANFKTMLVDYGIFSPRNQLFMPRLIKAQDLDVFHSTNYMIPFLAFPRDFSGKTACVTTIHDLIPLMFPDAAPRSRKKRLFPLFRGLMRETALRSRLIITVSESSRHDIIGHLPCPAERVIAIPEGVHSRFRPKEADFSPEEHSGQKTEKILWVGRQDPYKNLLGLMEAFALLRKKYGGGLELRLAGPADPRYPEPALRAQELGIADSVKWLGHIADASLVTEYRNADMFVMPSLYEGFGLPALEAFACGTPVICGDRASLPEICGEAALLVNPENAAELCDAMLRVLTDKKLAADLARRGLKQAAKYTWNETARLTILAYEKAMITQLN